MSKRLQGVIGDELFTFDGVHNYTTKKQKNITEVKNEHWFLFMFIFQP